jgi:hypothetical protein
VASPSSIRPSPTSGQSVEPWPSCLNPPAAPGRAGGPAAGGAPAGGRGGAPAAAPEASTKLADGVYKINGAYNALAVEFDEYVMVIEAGQNVARGQAIVDEVTRLFPVEADPVRRQHASALGSRRRPGAARGRGRHPDHHR